MAPGNARVKRVSIAYNDRTFPSAAAITNNCNSGHSPAEVDYIRIDLSAPAAIEEIPTTVAY
jgi:hypothetical protein